MFFPLAPISERGSDRFFLFYYAGPQISRDFARTRGQICADAREFVSRIQFYAGIPCLPEENQGINAKNRGCFQGGFRLSGFGAGSDGTPPRQGPQVQACPFLQPWTE